LFLLQFALCTLHPAPCTLQPPSAKTKSRRSRASLRTSAPSVRVEWPLRPRPSSHVFGQPSKLGRRQQHLTSNHLTIISTLQSTNLLHSIYFPSLLRCAPLSYPRAHIRNCSKTSMLFPSYVAAVTLLAVLPLLFFVARCVAKRLTNLSWSIDDTLLTLSLVDLIHCSVTTLDLGLTLARFPCIHLSPSSA
jgi:hypothetical protein